MQNHPGHFAAILPPHTTFCQRVRPATSKSARADIVSGDKREQCANEQLQSASFERGRPARVCAVESWQVL